MQRAASKAAAARTPSTPEETDTLKLKKSWELALAPAKQLPMNAIMMYMSGNSLQIFSIMMVWMLFMNPLKGLLGINAAFERFETDGNARQAVARQGRLRPHAARRPGPGRVEGQRHGPASVRP